MSTDQTHLSRRHRADFVSGPAWVAWHSKVRIAVLTVALFMALC